MIVPRNLVNYFKAIAIFSPNDDGGPDAIPIDST